MGAEKIAVDAGKAYHFQFLPELPHDPYGTVVDRCARRSKLARGGTVVCSADYASLISSECNEYTPAGEFLFHGLPNKTEVYVRTLLSVDSTYIEPLLTDF